MRLHPHNLLAALAALLALSVLCAPATAASPGGPVSDERSWESLAEAIARPWPGLQYRQGGYRDYVWGGGLGMRYGESMLGYSLLLEGVRTGDRALSDSGLRALDYVVGNPRRSIENPSIFENLAVAGSYNIAVARFKDDPLLAPYRDKWESWLRNVRVLRMDRRDIVANKQIVEAVAILELLRTGVRSRDPKTVVGDRAGARKLILEFVNRRVPGLVKGTAVPVEGERTLVFSDPKSEPLAYHALSMGFLARAIQLLGSGASDAARGVLREAARASWRLASPTGDVSYIGRSQEQAWTLPFTAYGAEAAASLPGATDVERGRLHALADRVLERLRTRYAVGPAGLWITPALSTGKEGGLRALDVYAGASAYTGLTLLALEWAGERMSGPARTASSLAADAPHIAQLSTGEGDCVVVRTESTWFAVKRAPSFAEYPGDLRYDFGLATLEQEADGGWAPVVPVRPRTKRSRHDSAGPILLSGRRRGLPYGTRMRVDGRGAVRIAGGFRTANGAWLRTGVEFVFEPVADGVRLSFLARAGDRFEYSGFFVGAGARPTVAGRTVADERQRLEFSAPVTVARPEPGYSSGVDPFLVRVRTITTAQASGPTTIWAGPR